MRKISKKVIVDPDELHRFAVLLEGVSHSLNRKRRNLKTEYEDLKSVWKDKKYQRYSRIFEESMQEMEQFSRQAEKLGAYLKKKEKPIRRYLNNS